MKKKTKTGLGPPPLVETPAVDIPDDAVITVKDLVVHYETNEGVVEAVNGVSLELKKGDCFGLIGETGAGKTTIALSIMGLLPYPPSHIIQGRVYLNKEDLLEKTEEQMRKLRGKKMSMIFQDPMTALNPVHKVGDQIAEIIRIHQGVSAAEAAAKATEMLEMVGVPGDRYNDYPHQFSGGMKQRVIIAIAIACQPEIIIADEPTTALDVTIQAQVLDMMKELVHKFGTTLLMITHDFGVVAEICNKCAVIYAGQVVEVGTVRQVFKNPSHPYTIGLFDSIPDVDQQTDRLKPIKGMVANPMDLPPCCSFYDRCEFCKSMCRDVDPGYIEVEPGHLVKCLHPQRKGGE